MHMFCRIVMGTALIGLTTGANAAGQSTLLQQQTRTSADGTRRIAIHDDGTIEAERAEPGLDTRITIKMVGHVAIIQTDDGISTTSKVVDLDGNAAWLKSHPDLATKIQSAQTWLAQQRKSGHSSRTAALGGTCAVELQNLLDAADAAVLACSGGGGIVCALAVSDYGKAKDSYNSCMKVISPPRQE